MPSARGRRTAVPLLHARLPYKAPRILAIALPIKGLCGCPYRSNPIAATIMGDVSARARNSHRSRRRQPRSPAAELAPTLADAGPLRRAVADLALHALVKARHIDDHALVRALADPLTLVAGLDAEADGAPLDFHNLRRRNDGEPHRCRRKMAHVEPDPEALMPGGQEGFCRCQCGGLDQADHHRGGQHGDPIRSDARRRVLRRNDEAGTADQAGMDGREVKIGHGVPIEVRDRASERTIAPWAPWAPRSAGRDGVRGRVGTGVVTSPTQPPRVFRGSHDGPADP